MAEIVHIDISKMLDDAGREKIAKRFWPRVAKAGDHDCWLWTGPPQNGGYGYCYVNYKKLLAHRVSYALSKGSPLDQMVCNACDTPLCVNPAHLWLGSSFDNARDARDKGRSRGMQLSHCLSGHEFTPANTYIRKNAKGIQTCRTCNAEAVSRYKLRLAGVLK